MTADVLTAMDGTPSHMKMPSASKLRPSPAIPGSMEAAIKMWLQVGNVQKLQQVSDEISCSALRSRSIIYLRNFTII